MEQVKWIRHHGTETPQKFHKNFDTCFFLPKIDDSKASSSIYATRVTETGTPIRGPSPNPLV